MLCSIRFKLFIGLLVGVALVKAQECSVRRLERFDCYPEVNGTDEELCKARGCCWLVPEDPNDISPRCFYPTGYAVYTFSAPIETDFGYTLNVTRLSSAIDIYPDPVERLQMDVIFVSDATLRIRITDPENERWEPPYPNVSAVFKQKNANNPIYTFQVTGHSGFQVVRNIDRTIIFDTSGLVFMYYDQFIQISSRLNTLYIYGIGEHQTSFALPLDYTTLTLFNHDVPPPAVNVYSSHPFYLGMESRGNSHGVFLLNSNAMEVNLLPNPALVYRTLGGILDFFFFLGPTPRDVVQQYVAVIGQPTDVPFWAFGFHLCRYGIQTLENTKTILQRNLDAGIPIEVQWNDIDYMDSKKDFTFSSENFTGLGDFVRDLQAKNMRWIPIIDPGIDENNKDGSYPPYDRGVELDIFVKNSSGEILLGKVWSPGYTVFPDFTHPNATDYWYEMLNNFHELVPFDGVWIDMNEPSNFVHGSVDGCDNSSSLEEPPYVPHLESYPIFSKTICMTAQQALGVHYNLHNLYGFSEAMVTNLALKKIKNERPVIITRSTFPGAGAFAGHWSGDIHSTWEDMKRSVGQVLNFGLFGMPFMGADICGFNGDTDRSLCSRWFQLGAFYPFARNHNGEHEIDQDPVALGDQVVASAKKALSTRYSLLSYIYTSFMNLNGYEPLARPLFYEFPEQRDTFNIDFEFLLGPALLVIPCFIADGIKTDAYFPEGGWRGGWFDFYTKERISAVWNVTIPAPLDTIPLFIRAGYILTLQNPENTTTATRANNLQLLAAVNDDGTAIGSLFWDDGISIGTRENKQYTFVNINITNGVLQLNNELSEVKDIPPLESVTILNVNRPGTVKVNDVEHDFQYTDNEDGSLMQLDLVDLNLDLTINNTITWS